VLPSPAVRIKGIILLLPVAIRGLPPELFRLSDIRAESPVQARLAMSARFPAGLLYSAIPAPGPSPATATRRYCSIGPAPIATTMSGPLRAIPTASLAAASIPMATSRPSPAAESYRQAADSRAFAIAMSRTVTGLRASVLVQESDSGLCSGPELDIVIAL
jgi:hypothetical protein